MKPYYADESVTLYHGDCRDATAWLEADVLVTDPPYGIGWARPDSNSRRGWSSDAHEGIANDHDTSARDAALAAWGDRPALIFGSFSAPFPPGVRQVLVYAKGAATGVIGSFYGWRKDAEPIFLVGKWPRRPAERSSVIRTAGSGVGPFSPAGRSGHPHTKPGDVLGPLIEACPPGVVADPFAGSGSTLVAAKALGRLSVGVEIDERYCETAARRLSQDVLDFGGAA